MNDGEQPDWRRLLSPQERARMLGDIDRVCLAVGARLFPDQPWQDLDASVGSLAAHKSPIECLAFIERLLPLLTQAVFQIGRNPITDPLSHSRPVTPPIRARRVTTAALLDAARRGPAARSLEEIVTTASVDTPENHAVKSFLLMLMRDSAAITQIAAAEGEIETAGRAEQCRRSLRGLLTSPWWEEVTTDGTAWTKPPSSRATRRPEYASVCRERARYRASFAFDWCHPLLTLPQRETWRLYETWGLFVTLDALIALGYRPILGTEAETPDLFTVREGRLTFTLATGIPSHITLRSLDGQRLSLIYNQTFAEGRHSLSHTMQPDITLASDTNLWILDAKFKPYALPGEEGDDINQMHAYRDAIIDTSGQRNVARAWCLYAGQTDAPNRARITYGRSEEAAVGALCLRPGDEITLTNLRALLSDWLREAPPTAAPPVSPQI